MSRRREFFYLQSNRKTSYGLNFRKRAFVFLAGSFEALKIEAAQKIFFIVRASCACWVVPLRFATRMLSSFFPRNKATTRSGLVVEANVIFAPSNPARLANRCPSGKISPGDEG